MKVLSVFGTRPEAIKMAPVVRALARDPRFDARVCVTAQHREMLDSVLATFGLVPDHDLGVMAPGQDLFDVTSRVLVALRDVLRAERPALVLVHGDTTTCFAGALAAFYEGVPAGHVEAGLRTGDLARPFPEEANRVLVSRLAALHFAPTAWARDNLLAEGVPPEAVHVTGNTVVDALLEVHARVATLGRDLLEPLLGAALLERLAPGAPTVLVTGHRRESLGPGFERLCEGLRRAALAHPDWTIVYPVHPNPAVRATVVPALAGLPNVFLTAPLDYQPFVWLLGRARAVLTDSGGVQEEAPSLGTPVLVTRECTERPEALAAGTATLVGTDPARIVEGLERLMADDAPHGEALAARNPYGDGRAAQRIVEALTKRLLEAARPAA